MATKIAVPSRGAYSVKGTPGGIKPPKAPVAGQVVTGKQGVDWVYRPGGPEGAGFYKKPKPTPSVTASKPTTGAAAAGTTIQAPAPSAASTTQTTTTSTPPGADWWTRMMGSGIATSASTPVLSAEQNQIGSAYGLVLNRDTAEGSPTKGQPLFRLPGQAAGTGTIRQSGFDEKGNPVYKDAAGNVISNVADLALDYTTLKPGEAGYLQGALGAAAAGSANNQQTIAENAARAGVRRSGMRAQGSLAEEQNLQGALAGLSQRAASEYTTNLGKWAALYNSIYQGLVPQAEALAAPVTTTTEVPAAAPEVAAGGPSYAGAPTDTTSYAGYGLPKSGSPLSAGAGGEFMRLVNGIVNPTAAGGGTYGYDAQVQSLELMKKNYSLTPQQIRWIDNWIANNKPKPKPKPSKGKGK